MESNNISARDFLERKFGQINLAHEIGVGIDWEDIVKCMEEYKLLNNNSDWVSVEQRLPENKQLVLFRCDNGLILSGLFYALDEYYRPNIFNDYTAPYPLDFVTHWMPVPQLPIKQ